jgi:hypothetical protein
MGQSQSARCAGPASDSARDRTAVMNAEPAGAEERQSRTSVGREQAIFDPGEGYAGAARLADVAAQSPARSDAAPTMLVASGRSLPDGKGAGSVAARGEGLATRARYTAQLGPVHVLARKDPAGIELIVRVANIEGDLTDELEQRLRQAAAEDGAWVSAMRLNGADRPAGSGGTGNG